MDDPLRWDGGREGREHLSLVLPLLLPFLSALFAFIFLQVVDDDTIATFNLSNIPGSLYPLPLEGQ